MEIGQTYYLIIKMEIRKCNCGEEFDFEGWNIKEKVCQGNAYHIKREGNYRVKYIKCNKCGKEVILNKERFLCK